MAQRICVDPVMVTMRSWVMVMRFLVTKMTMRTMF